MNFMDLYLLNRANKLGDNLNSGSSADGFPTAQVSVRASEIPNAPHTVPVLMTMNNRYGGYAFSWSSAVNGESTYYSSLANSTTSIEQCFWGAMGGGMQPNADASNTSESTGMTSEHPSQEAGGARVLYAKDDRVGRAQSWMQYSGSASWSPVMMAVMFVKNTTSSAISKTLGLTYTTGGQGGYTGAGIATITPNNTSKKTTTATTSVNLLEINTQGSSSNNSTASATFAAGKTTAVVFSSSGYYWGSGAGAMGTIRCHLTGLDSLFDGSLEPDLNMHATALQTRNNNFNRAEPYLLWKECGDVLGDK